MFEFKMMCIDWLLPTIGYSVELDPASLCHETGEVCLSTCSNPLLESCEYNWFLVYPCIKLLKVGNGGLGGGFLYCF